MESVAVAETEEPSRVTALFRRLDDLLEESRISEERIEVKSDELRRNLRTRRIDSEPKLLAVLTSSQPPSAKPPSEPPSW